MDSLPLYKCVYDTYGLEVLTDTPRLTVTTIHQAKGGEWDKVIVLTDVSTATYEQFKNGSEADRDAEARVWYVALTRARKCLQIIRPHTHKFYPLKGVT
jgi:superfamily I DNA/RNA helicase